jgi:hypothetical protein
LLGVTVKTAALTTEVCFAQQLVEGSKGARLIQWPVEGLISSMAVSDEAGAVVAGRTWFELDDGFSTLPMLWRVEQDGTVVTVNLPGLSPQFSYPFGFANALSRNGQWAGGATLSTQAPAEGALWDVNDPTTPRPIGLTVLGAGGQPVTGRSSSVVAVSDDGTSFGTSVDPREFPYGVVEPLGQNDATVLPWIPPTSGVISNLQPMAVSTDGTVVTGQSLFFESNSGTFPRATLWQSDDELAQLMFDDDITSFASAVSPSGRYVGGYHFSSLQGEDTGRGFIFDRQTEQRKFLSDDANVPWNAPVVDISDDGRVTVGGIDFISGYGSLTLNSGFVALDGVAHRLADWLAEEFDLPGLSIEVVEAVVLNGDRYHFAAQSRNLDTLETTAYYISIPVLSVFPTEPTGDYNGDGMVDAADYTVWRDEFGRSESPLDADGNRDGTVDQADYELWKMRVGDPVGGTAAGGPVPEPETLPIILTAMVAMLSPKRRGIAPTCN